MDMEMTTAKVEKYLLSSVDFQTFHSVYIHYTFILTKATQKSNKSIFIPDFPQ